LKIIKVREQSDVHRMSLLAHEIWWQHFPPIIGEDQVAYMVEKFQSEQAMLEQLEQGYEYFLADLDGEAVGYAGVVPDLNTHKLMLSKLYVIATDRGKGVGQALLDLIESKCVEEGFNRIWLTVNRANKGPINWYIKRGFTIVKEIDMDIGDGFIMDDYVMEKPIGDDEEMTE